MQEEQDAREPELIGPEDFFNANPFPPDARRLGFDRYSDEGALIGLASALNPGKRSHKIAAWLMLLVISLPMILRVWADLRGA